MRSAAVCPALALISSTTDAQTRHRARIAASVDSIVADALMSTTL
jgi:hypothetical protein